LRNTSDAAATAGTIFALPEIASCGITGHRF